MVMNGEWFIIAIPTLDVLSLHTGYAQFPECWITRIERYSVEETFCLDKGLGAKGSESM